MRLDELVVKAVNLAGRFLPFEAPQLVLLQAMAAAHDGRSREAVERLEGLIGLAPEDYTEPLRLAARLETSFTGMSQENQLGILMALAGALGMEQRHDDALALLEADLGVAREGFADSSRLAASLKHRLAELPPDIEVGYLVLLIGVLGVASRDHDGMRVLAASPLGDGAEFGSEEFCVRIEGYLDELQGEVAAGLLLFLIPVLANVGQAAAGLRLLSHHFGFGDGRVLDWGRLAHLNPNTAAQIIVVSAIALAANGRDSEASDLFFADLSFSPLESDDLSDLVALSRARLEDLHSDVATTYLRSFAASLGNAGRSAQAAALLELDAGLTASDWTTPDHLARRLAERLATVSEGVGAAFVFELASTLQDADRNEHAASLLDVYFAHFAPLEGRNGAEHALVPQLCPLFTYWLRHFGQDTAAEPVAACRRFVPLLRRGFVHQGVDLRDRAEFIEYVGELRQRIVEVGRFWARKEEDEGQRHALELEVELWDAELEQRLLFERFLLTRIRLVTASGTPSPDWAFHERLPEDWQSGASGFLDESGFLSESWSAPRHGDAVAGFVKPEAEGTDFRSTWPELYEEVRDLVGRGIDEARLAEILGPGSLLVRATFGVRGQLLWSAIESDGKRVESRISGSSEDGALERLRWATARHDFRLALARLLARRDFSKTGVVKRIRQALDALLKAGKSSADQVGERLGEIFGEPGNRLAERAQSLLVLICSPFFAPWTLDWTRQRLAEEIAFLDRVTALRSTLRATLDATTADYLAEVAAIWDLDRLEAVLGTDHDVLFQVDDALHAVPVAHLSVAGRPLWRRARSVRTTLALLMNVVTARIESERRDDRQHAAKILAVSHLDPQDPAVRGGMVLHHGLTHLARENGLAFYNAAHYPPASLGMIRAACEAHRRFAVAAVCGHGDFYRSGIRLPATAVDGESELFWHGAGCDLSCVDWLWLVSCSLGRLRQNGDRDVQGFCVELALHRARSVAAYRWPVNAVEAAIFTHRAVEHYLKLTSGNPDEGEGRWRAQALNAARRSFLCGEKPAEDAMARPGLNTIAACELYGAG